MITHTCMIALITLKATVYSVQSSHSVTSDSLQSHGLQHARHPCPSPTSRVYPNSCPLSWWCHRTISSSVVPLDGHKIVAAAGKMVSIKSPIHAHLFFFNLNLFIFDWKIIALQYCVGFCHVSTRICHRYKNVRSLLNLPPTPTPFHPCRLSQSTGVELPFSYSRFPLAI